MSGDDHGSEVAIHGGFVTGMADASGGVEVPDLAERGGPSFATVLLTELARHVLGIG